MFKKTEKMSLLVEFRGICRTLLCLMCGGLLLSGGQDALAQGDAPNGSFANLTAEFLRVRSALGSSRIAFGPNNVRTVGIDAAGGLTGIVLRDPIGFRLVGTGVNSGRLFFGPTNDCSVEVSPRGPVGLLLRDPRGIRILPPVGGRTTMFFGPTDDCSLGIDANLTGLIERDPIGFRLLGRSGAGCRLLFGPTDDCTIEVDPVGPSGLILRDPKGIRILNPDQGGANLLQFGPTDDCRIFVDPNLPGMRFSDPKGFAFDNNMDVNGTVMATDFVTTSARRFKENIQPLENALDKITSLQGVTFDWKPDHGGKPDIGFIAEEVEKVAPELVSWDNKHQLVQGVKYANVVAITVEGIKEQQKQIERLQKENSSLRENLDSFQSQIDELTEKIKELANAGTK